MNVRNHKSDTLIIAHRGASYDAPENTLASFKLGFEQQADAIECDVRLSADNIVFVIHDETTTRTTGINKKVETLSYDELKRLDAGGWKDSRYKNERLPTLKEAFEILPPDKKIVVEIKSGIRVIEPVSRLLAQNIIPHSQIMMMAFDLETVIRLRERYRTIEVLWLLGFPPLDSRKKNRAALRHGIDTALKYQLDGINIQNRPELDADTISACKANHLKCYCWTVNDPERARYLMNHGIDGIATDRPGWIRENLRDA